MLTLDAIEAQGSAVAALRRAIARDRVASAYLFEGPSGVGKEQAALGFAAEAIGPGGADAAQLRERIAGDKHPDVRVFRPRDEGKRNIPVDFVRDEILPVARYAPFESARAFLVFPDADVSFPMEQPAAANALLKTLEEPRRGVTFILLAPRPDALLQTIRSRCQRLRFGPLPPATLERILAERGVSPEARGPAIALAGGRADRALELAEQGRAAAMLALALDVDAAVASRRPGRITDAAEALAKAEPLAVALDALGRFYRDVACVAVGAADTGGAPEDDPRPTHLAFGDALDTLRQRARGLSVMEATRRVAAVERARRSLARNANVQLAMDALVFGMSRGQGGS
ncbi:MAG: hypothetical protein KC543_08435 [Myxococcales bacterium]|nr:hypothetical protein [Myxococcales bacterium]